MKTKKEIKLKTTRVTSFGFGLFTCKLADSGVIYTSDFNGNLYKTINGVKSAPLCAISNQIDFINKVYELEKL